MSSVAQFKAMNNTEKIALAKPSGLFTLSFLSANIRSCADVDSVYVDDERGAGWGANPVTPREHVCWHTRHTAAGRITVSDPAPLRSALWQDRFTVSAQLNAKGSLEVSSKMSTTPFQ